jgi:hypothetical protein
MSLQEKSIKHFAIIENFMSEVINNNAQTVIDSFKPFLGKKIRTANGFVSKYIKPELTPIIPQELKEIGINGLHFYIQLETYTRSIQISFRFNMYGKDSIFENFNSQNPFGSGYITEYITSLDIEDTTLIKIPDFKPRILVNVDQVIQDYQKAVALKSEYDKALNKVHYRIRSYAK